MTTSDMVQAAATPANGTASVPKDASANKNKITNQSDPANGTLKASTPDAGPDAATAPVENGGDSKKKADNGTSQDQSTAADGNAVDSETQRKKEDEIAAKGAEVAGIRALLSRAFTKPSEEPAIPATHWTFLLEEMRWLAVDFSQERLWRHTAAMAIAYEIAKKKGEFGLQQPPKEHRKYSDEIRSLRVAVSKADNSGTAPASGGRRSSSRRVTDSTAAPTGPTLASFLGLDQINDPIFVDLEAPGTPLQLDSLTFTCDIDEVADTLEKSLMKSDIDRIIQEETAYRSYKLEYEASVVSHQLAVAEQIAEANTVRIGSETGFGGDGGEDMDGFDVGAAKKSGKKRNRSAANRSSGRILELDNFGDEGDEFGIGSKRSAHTKASSYNEDRYFNKRRPIRTPSCRDADVDFDIHQEGLPRYTTRRQTGALARQRAAVERTQRGRGGVGRGAEVYQQQQTARARSQAGMQPGTPLWSKSEDELLLAVVHEFGVNWTLVSEVLSLSLGMQGIYRPQNQCRQRFRQLTMQEGTENYSEERAYASLSQQMTKQQARELLVGALPVRDDALVRLLETLAQVGAAANQKRIQEDKRNDASRQIRQDPHPSYTIIFNSIMQQTGNRHLNPLELCVTVNNAYLNQARQQQLLAQQAAMQQQGAAAAGVAPGGLAPPNQQQSHQPSPPVQQQQQPQQGVAQGVAQGTPAGQPPLGPAGTPPGPPPNAASQPGPPQPAKPPGHPTPQVTLQQLDNILKQNKLPNGQEMDEKMRKAIEAKRSAFFVQMQQQQQQQQQQRMAVGGGAGLNGQPPQPPGAGVPPNHAMTATMHAAMQAGARPSLPPGMYGIPPAGMQQLQQLPPQQQQQLLAQQQLLQQQQQAAAMAQQQQSQQNK